MINIMNGSTDKKKKSQVYKVSNKIKLRFR